MLPFLIWMIFETSAQSTTPNPCFLSTESVALAERSKTLNKFQSRLDEQRDHLCLLNYPKNDYCQQWRVVVLIILTDPIRAADNTAAIKQFLRTSNEYCGKGDFLMPFLPASPNPSCRLYQFSGNSSNWLDNLSAEMLLVPYNEDPATVFEQLILSLYYCSQKSLSSQIAGAIFLMSDMMCEPLCSHYTFGDTVNNMIFNVTMTKYVTTSYFLGNYSDFEQSCLNVIFLFCALYNKQICAVQFYSDLTQFENSAKKQHTCALNKKEKGDTGLILEIVLPCIVGVIILMIIVILIIRHRSRKTWFKFWWEHTNGESIAAEKQQEIVMNEYYDNLGQRRDSWEICPKNLEIKEDDFLGHGAFAVVYKGTLKDTVPLLTINTGLVNQIEGEVPGGYEVAVKKLPNHADDRARSDFLKELDFMKALGYHTHIISLLGCISNPINPMIVEEYCYYGDLLQFLRKHKGDFLPDGYVQQPVPNKLMVTVKDLLSFSWQICDGMVYLSSHNFIHRDLAARNVLLTKKLVAKIGDFGLCREVDTALYTTQGGRLPIKWMAIESLKYYEYTTKSDVWSYGVLLFEIFSFGEGPFQGVQPMEMVLHLEQGNRLPKPDHCLDEIYEIMEKCWLKQPENRPSFSEISSEVGTILRERDSHYGYLSLDPRYSSTEEYFEHSELQI